MIDCSLISAKLGVIEMRKIDVDDLVEDDSMNLYKTKKPIR